MKRQKLAAFGLAIPVVSGEATENKARVLLKLQSVGDYAASTASTRMSSRSLAASQRPPPCWLHHTCLSPRFPLWFLRFMERPRMLSSTVCSGPRSNLIISSFQRTTSLLPQSYSEHAPWVLKRTALPSQHVSSTLCDIFYFVLNTSRPCGGGCSRPCPWHSAWRCTPTTAYDIIGAA